MGQNFSSEPVVEKETERAHNDTFNVAVSSCQGWRMSQEDNHSLILDLSGEHKAAFFAVYDGHGSARVSKHASESLWRHLVENDMYIKGNFKEALESAFLTFDREVNESYNAQLAGTTAVCLLIVDNIIYCANIGDSRGVACVNCECVPLSYDHKPENPLELKRILAAGGYVLGNRVNGNLALSRAFGDFHYKGNEQLPPEQQIVSPCPDVKLIELNDDVDFLLLACDGIWDVLSSEEVVEFVIARLEQNMEPGLICEQLTTRCLATDYELVIGCDNMTVLLICYTRGRSWVDYCTDIFNKNTKRLGIPRTLSGDQSSNVDTLEPKDEILNYNAYNSMKNVMSSALSEQESSSATKEVEEVENLELKEEKDAVLRQVDKEPELEQTCTVTEIPGGLGQEEQMEDDHQQGVIEEADKSEEMVPEPTTTAICHQEDTNTEESKGESDTMCKIEDNSVDAVDNYNQQSEIGAEDNQDDDKHIPIEEENDTQQEESLEQEGSQQQQEDEKEAKDQESNSDSTSQSNEVEVES